MNTEENIKYVTARYPDAYMRKYAALSMVIWCPLLKCRLSGFFHTGDEAWADSVEFIDRLKNRKKPMTTQLPNGYKAVKVPEGAKTYAEINISEGRVDFVWRVSCPGKYSLIGRADELTEEQVKAMVESYTQTVGWQSYDRGEGLPTITAYMNYGIRKPVPVTFLFFTALESFRSLLASLHLEPHTTIILKKENV